MTMIDDCSRYTEVYFLKFKSEAMSKIKEYVKYVENKFEKKRNTIRSDNGREYITKELKEWLIEQEIKVQYTAPYSPFQNGVAERKNRTPIEAARCMLMDAGMEKKYWAEAVDTACYLQNMLPSKAVGRTPFELWSGRKANVEHLHIFGCKGYAHIPKEKRRKLDDKAKPLTFVGYSTESKAYRMLDRTTNSITISRDVRFIEYDLNNNEQTSSQDEQDQEELDEDQGEKDDKPIDQVRARSRMYNGGLKFWRLVDPIKQTGPRQ